MSKRDEDDGVFDDSDDDDEEEPQPPKKRKKMDKSSMIDDAAEESGDEDGDEDDEDEDDDDNEYVKDGFVVDEEEEKRKKDDLEDSDEDDDEDDDDDKKAARQRLKKVRKMRQFDRLDDDDMALIQEAQEHEERPTQAEIERQRIVAKSEAELRKGLFYDTGDEDGAKKQQERAPVRVERYDEDGMDDFIDDDIGDQGDILASERRGTYGEGDEEINEAQLAEASEIFGTDYLDFMAEEGGEEDEDEEELLGSKYRERGVGVQLGVDSEDDLSEDEDLFDDDDDDDEAAGTSEQRKEALRLKREKRRLAKEERRREAAKRKAEKRKAQLRRAFEPVQLVENFCTDRDDEIRQTDIPERMFDWSTPFHGSEAVGMTDQEREEAMWIASRIPEITMELTDDLAASVVYQSITNALRFMHKDRLEPAFISRYRRDYVNSDAVRRNLYAVMDEDGEWNRLLGARSKVDALVMEITTAADGDAATGVDAQKVHQLHEELHGAQKLLDESAKQESVVKADLEALGGVDDDDDDDDDELFGDGGDKEEAKKKEKSRLMQHLETVQALLQARAEKVSQLQSQLQVAEAQNRALNDPMPAERVTQKTARAKLWNSGDYVAYLASLNDTRHILDLNGYLKLIKEGNDAIRKKEMPLLYKDKKDNRKRSRRFDRDFYRTCVSEGLRSVSYRFLLAPNRVGIKLEDTATKGAFDFSRTMLGEEGSEGAGDPLKWSAPSIHSSSPAEFASELIGSGELVVLSSTGKDEQDKADPLRGCRYVAAMELAHEPRVRRYLREIYRRAAVLTSKPTKKGMQEIDAFHDYYGLHLIRNKPVKDHFPVDKAESEARKIHLGEAERKEFDLEMKKKQRDSCLQYLNLLKAEQTGDISVHIHLPFLEQGEDWYKTPTDRLVSRDNQDLSSLMNELKKVYFPLDSDTHEWNAEREKVLHFALTNFLLPQFEAEVRRDLRDAAGSEGVVAAGENLKETAMQGPYRPAAILHSENRFLYPTGDLSLVGVCCASDGKDATYLASVTDRGESNDFLAIPSGTRVDGAKMREKVIMFLLQSRPSAVIVGTSGGFESRLLHRKMNDIITEAMSRWKNRDIQGEDEDDDAFEERRGLLRNLQPPGHYDEEDEEDWKCNVELFDDSVAQLFGRSVRGKKEFPDYAINLKSAIAVARFAKDPLAEYSYAWSVASDTGVFGTEMLYLNIHPMQQLMPRTMLLRQYERVLCDVVADVGVDINKACSQDHLRGLLMFVPGLGPRKAANVKHVLSQQGGTLARRNDLLKKRILGPFVYNNAVAFLKISEADQAEHQLHPLEGTRLHPDVYLRNNWAIKIAFDALEREDQRSKEAAAIKALRDVMDNSSREVERLFFETKKQWEDHYGPTFNTKDWDPRENVPADQWRDKVEELDLNAFANMIEENGHGKWHSHLEMIKWEFRLPFTDPRKPMEPLGGDTLFRLITGESDQSLRPGKEITGKVIRNGDFGSRVKLEGDIPAFIPLRNLSDEHVETAEEYVQPGQVITAIVTEVKKDHMTVDMSLKMEDFRKKPSSWERPQSLPPLDDRFDLAAALRIEDENAKKREAHIEALQLSLGLKSEDDAEGGRKKRLGRVARRACTHPAFRNAKNDEVTAELKAGGAAMVGECLIRPSSKSSDSLALHWVVREGAIKVVEIIEEDKETEASIGNTLKIKDDVYGSIDELLGRYIAPMNDYVEDMANHRKFMDLPEDEVDEKLMELKQATPKAIPYAFCWMDMHPGYASLRFVGSVTPRSHPIGITPHGFSWSGKPYTNLDKLVSDFKRNPRGVQKPTEPPAKPPAPKPPAKPPRWGAKAVQPPPPPMPPPAWDRPPPPPVPPPAAPPIHVTASWGPQQGWGQPQQQPPPQPYGMPPPRPPPPTNLLPPGPPAYAQLPPQGPPAFDMPPTAPSQGRGRGRTLPAWMSKG